MAITASLVSELRKKTDCGIMECKKALTEADGDIDRAVEILRKNGLAKADKKAGRTAAEGAIVNQTSDDHKHAVMLEVNCETDFVARDQNFKQFVEKLAQLALSNQVTDIDALNELALEDGQTVEQVRQALIAKLGENIQMRRIASTESSGVIGSYVHMDKIGVLVALTIDDMDLARDVAMHVAASNPAVISPDQISAEVVEREKAIYREQAAASGKPDNIVEKMVEGRLKKYLNEQSLVGQPFVKNSDVTVGQLLKEKNAEVQAFIRYELGEGIEKETQNFAEEVMAQVRG